MSKGFVSLRLVYISLTVLLILLFSSVQNAGAITPPRSGKFPSGFWSRIEQDTTLGKYGNAPWVKRMAGRQGIENPVFAALPRCPIAHSIIQAIGKQKPAHSGNSLQSEEAEILLDLSSLRFAPCRQECHPCGRSFSEIPAVIDPRVVNADQHTQDRETAAPSAMNWLLLP